MRVVIKKSNLWHSKYMRAHAILLPNFDMMTPCVKMATDEEDPIGYVCKSSCLFLLQERRVEHHGMRYSLVLNQREADVNSFSHELHVVVLLHLSRRVQLINWHNG